MAGIGGWLDRIEGEGGILDGCGYWLEAGSPRAGWSKGGMSSDLDLVSQREVVVEERYPEKSCNQQLAAIGRA